MELPKPPARNNRDRGNDGGVHHFVRHLVDQCTVDTCDGHVAIGGHRAGCRDAGIQLSHAGGQRRRMDGNRLSVLVRVQCAHRLGVLWREVLRVSDGQMDHHALSMVVLPAYSLRSR